MSELNKIKRWDVFIQKDGGDALMEQVEDGEYVLFSDVERLLSELRSRVRDELDVMISNVKDIMK